MNKRQERNLLLKGVDLFKINELVDIYLKDMQKRGLTFEEAKLVVGNMVCILDKSEKYRPETLLARIPLRKV